MMTGWKRYRAAVPVMTWVAAGCLILAAETAPAPDLESARATLARWVETREMISREKKDWEQGREMLVSRIGILRKEIAQLEEKLAATRGAENDAGKARADVMGQIDAVKSVTADLGVHVAGLEGTVRTLYMVLPESLREKVQPLYDRMPEPETVSKVSLAERFQNVLGILNEMSKLNSEISVVSEIRPLSSGKPSEVRTIYVGLGQAYFVSALGEAGVGRPTPTGWAWHQANEIAEDVNHALEILQNKSKPGFVALPVEIK